MDSREKIVLGIDAAWTPTGSSGVALLRKGPEGTSIVAHAPSYSSFVGLAEGKSDIWTKSDAGRPNIPALLEASVKLSGRNVDLVAIDMPVSKHKITGRRHADNQVSKAFGSRQAGTHSPNKDRPGALGEHITQEFLRAGFEIATTQPQSQNAPTIIEVYPLAAITQLLKLNKRPLYKVGKLKKYMPDSTPTERFDYLISIWADVIKALEASGLTTNWRMPENTTLLTASRLKLHEDALDAIICAWIGECFLNGTAEPYGDEHAAIWIPKPSVPLA